MPLSTLYFSLFPLFVVLSASSLCIYRHSSNALINHLKNTKTNLKTVAIINSLFSLFPLFAILLSASSLYIYRHSLSALITHMKNTNDKHLTCFYVCQNWPTLNPYAIITFLLISALLLFWSEQRRSDNQYVWLWLHLLQNSHYATGNHHAPGNHHAATFKDVLFPGHNHLLTTGRPIDDPTLQLLP